MAAPIPRRHVFITCIGLLAAALAGCTQPSKSDPAQAHHLAELRRAISELEVARGQEPTESYKRAWTTIRAADSPAELREIAAHFEDPRPTLPSGQFDNGDGEPVIGTVGEALFSSETHRFFRASQYMIPGRNCPAYFGEVADFRRWLEKHDYDMASLKRSYERDVAALRNR